LGHLPAPALFIVSATSLYGASALGVRLFEVVPSVGVAWLRLLVGAAVLLAWRRPWQDGSRVLRARPGLPVPIGLLVGFGVVLAAMNLAYYLSIERLPLGTAVAIQFLGPIAIAAAGTRTARDLLALLLAVAGIGLLLRIELELGAADAAGGVLIALAAAATWALYILLGRRVAARGPGVDGLAIAMLIGTALTVPLGAPSALPPLVDPRVALACLAVGLLSGAIPFVLEQTVLARVGPSRFALLTSLLPATAAVVGALALAQVPSLAQATGIVLVSAAVALQAPN
jgi:inner membrane transporter RhtA